MHSKPEKMKYPRLIFVLALLIVLGGIGTFLAFRAVSPQIYLERVYHDGNLGFPSGYDILRDEIDAEHQRQLEEQLRRLGGRRVELDVVPGVTEIHPVAIRVGEQPRDGTIFTTAGSGFFWTDGRPTMTVHVPLPNGEDRRVDFSVGRISGEGVGQFIATIDSSQIDSSVYLYVTRTYEVMEWIINSRPAQSDEPWQEYNRLVTLVPVSLLLTTELV